MLISEILEALEGELEILSQHSQGDPLELFYEECRYNLLEVFNLPLSQLQQYHERLLGRLHYSI